jgi:hypothetical protein
MFLTRFINFLSKRRLKKNVIFTIYYWSCWLKSFHPTFCSEIIPLYCQGSAQDCWSDYIFFNQIHYFMVKIFQNFMVKINTFWLSGGWGRPVLTGRGRTLYSGGTRKKNLNMQLEQK